MKLSDVRAAVWAGIGFLDSRVPRWRKKIDLKKLDLRYSDCCVLGELYGDYSEGVDRLFGGDNDKAIELGFDVEDYTQDEDADSEYKQLTAEWRAAYRAGQRRAKSLS